MPQSNDSIAVMLLCCRISAARQELFDPLSPPEFHALKQVLDKKLGKPVGWVLGRDIGEFMKELEIEEQEAHRLVVLTERMVSLSYELDKYDQHGVEVVTWEDKLYPDTLRRRLGVNAPAVLYASGNLNLFRDPVLTFIGSVPGEAVAMEQTRILCDRATKAEVVVATGATGGLDQEAEYRLFENGGRMIAWTPGGMLETIGREGLKELIAARRAAAVSVCHPESAVQSQNARGRSKCLYGCGAVSYVQGCEYKRGDTWDGAADALRGHYTDRMYVWDSNLYSGNAMLIKRGAVPVSGADMFDFEKLRTHWLQSEGEQLSVFDDRRLLY